tara:strand:- start:669 stop:3410 length:2742 start_codon:yes stop_codon:yes gene_type:complete
MKMSQYDNVSLFKILMLEGERGLIKIVSKTEPEKLTREEIEDKIDSIMEDMFSQKDIFSNFLTSTDNPYKTSMFNSKNKLDLGGSTPENIEKDLTNKLSAFRGYSNIPKNIANNFVKDFLLSQGLEGSDNSISDDSAETKNIKIINEILKNFKTSDKKSLTYNNVFVSEQNNLKNVIMTNRNLSKEQQDRYIKVIGTMRQNIQKELEPIVKFLQTYAEGSKTIVSINASDVIGSLDLKYLKSRENIYEFWEEVDKDYDKFKSAYSSFQDKIKELEDEDLPPQLEYIIKKLKSFTRDISDSTFNNNLRYTASFKPKSLENYMKPKKHTILFEKFLTEGGFVKKTRRSSKEDLLQVERNYDSEGEETSPTSSYVPDSGREISPDKLTEMGIILENFRDGDIEVDPLYHYAFTKKGGAFRNVPIASSKELDLIKKQLKTRGRILSLVRPHLDLDDDIENYIDELKDLIISNKGSYFLPISETLSGADMEWQETQDSSGYELESGKLSTKELNIKTNKIGNFLSIFSQIYDAGTDTKASPAVGSFDTTTGGKGDDDSKLDINEALEVNLGRSNDKNFLLELKQVEKELKKLLESILNYFILPLESRFVPFDDKFAFEPTQESDSFGGMGNSFIQTIKVIAGANPNDSAFARLMYLSSEKRGGSKLVNAEQLKQYTFLIKELTKPSSARNSMSLKNLLIDNGIEPTLEVLRTYAIKIEEDVNEEFGAYFYSTLKRNNLLSQWSEMSKKEGNEDGKFPFPESKFTPEEHFEKYNTKDRKNYPFAAIVNHIKRNPEQFSASESRGSKTKGKQGKGSTIVSDFLRTVSQLDIIKSDDELKILDAHDSIRKMMNKPIYYNTSKLDNFEHVNTAIDIMKNNYNVDVTANEIFLIVSEVNSLGEISVKHGVPKESVYFLKGSFR